MKIACPYCEGDFPDCAWCYGTGKMKTDWKTIKKLKKSQDRDNLHLEVSAP